MILNVPFCCLRNVDNILRCLALLALQPSGLNPDTLQSRTRMNNTDEDQLLGTV
jgi:hypothetical protein